MNGMHHAAFSVILQETEGLHTRINIAIDGFSSCGKSTLAKALARELKYKYIDTGAMYRAVALFAFRNNLVLNSEVDEQALRQRIDEIEVDFHFNPETRQNEAFLNGKSVESEIRNMEIAELASRVSKYRWVRDKLQGLQKKIAAGKGVIMDGRDIGTVVMPDAELKIFMTADPEIRAQRRFLELKAKDQDVTLEDVRRRQANRDYEDVHRAEDPLRKADDAIVLDNTNLNPEEQLLFVLDHVQARCLNLQA